MHTNTHPQRTHIYHTHTERSACWLYQTLILLPAEKIKKEIIQQQKNKKGQKNN